jgi:hypothetical protein
MTRPIAPEPLPGSIEAVSRMPEATGGHDFATLLTQVAGETNFKPNMVNKVTGAAGPYQFIKSTWLALVHDHGEEMGVKPDLVRQIHVDPKGHMSVAQPRALQDLLALRHDPALATRMAGKYLDIAQGQLKHLLRREPSETELNLTYLLGPAGAAHLIKTAAAHPDMPVDAVVGEAATANPTLFRHSNGAIRTAAEAVAFLADRYRAEKTRVQQMAAATAAEGATS